LGENLFEPQKYYLNGYSAGSRIPGRIIDKAVKTLQVLPKTADKALECRKIRMVQSSFQD